MRHEIARKEGACRRAAGALALAALLAAGCAQVPAPAPVPASSDPVAEVHGALPLLAYHQMLGRLNAIELARERSFLATLPAGPAVQLRQAMVIGHPRGQADTAKALALAEQVLRANEPAALELHGLARLLADQYSERLRLEGLLERQGAQLKDSQRKAQELQEKLDGLADIERTLMPRPRTGQGGQR